MSTKAVQVPAARQFNGVGVGELPRRLGGGGIDVQVFVARQHQGMTGAAVEAVDARTAGIPEPATKARVSRHMRDQRPVPPNRGSGLPRVYEGR